MFWPVDQAAEVMSFFRDILSQADDELTGFFVFMLIPPGPPFPDHLHRQRVCGVVWCHSGVMSSAEPVFQSIREQMPPVLDLTGPLPYPALQSMFDHGAPPGMQQYWRADFFYELTDEVIDLHAKYGARVPTLLSTTHIYPLSGVVQSLPKESTAFSYRDARWVEVIIGSDPDPENNEKITSWVKDYWLALHPHSAGGAYVNFLMDEGQERIRSTYRENYDRLAAVKSKYDPDNFFHINQNIPPERSDR